MKYFDMLVGTVEKSVSPSGLLAHQVQNQQSPIIFLPYCSVVVEGHWAQRLSKKVCAAQMCLHSYPSMVAQVTVVCMMEDSNSPVMPVNGYINYIVC